MKNFWRNRIHHTLLCLCMFICGASIECVAQNNKDKKNNAEHAFVDLGLPSGTLWAEYNVGATCDTEIGSYFAWGEIKEKSVYSYGTYFDADGKVLNTTKKKKASLIGTKYDTAKQLWGKKWVMPTREQAVELYTKCNWEWTENYKNAGVAGCIVTGPNGNSIFFPAGGLMMDNQHRHTTFGNIWIGELNNFNNIDWACFIDFSTKGPLIQPVPFRGSILVVSQDYRWWGRNVRAVRK